MGGEGSGRKPDPMKVFMTQSTMPVNPGVCNAMVLPNLSGVRDDARKDRPAVVITETDPLSLHLDQSTPQTVINGQPIFDEGLWIGNGGANPDGYLSKLNAYHVWDGTEADILAANSGVIQTNYGVLNWGVGEDEGDDPYTTPYIIGSYSNSIIKGNWITNGAYGVLGGITNYSKNSTSEYNTNLYGVSFGVNNHGRAYEVLGATVAALTQYVTAGAAEPYVINQTGLRSSNTVTGEVVVDDAYGVDVINILGADATITNGAYGLKITNSSQGTTPILAGIYIQDAVPAGTVTDHYGLWIADVTGATNNYAIKTELGKIAFGGLPSGTLVAPPAGLAIGDLWKDTTTSSQYPIIRIRAT